MVAFWGMLNPLREIEHHGAEHPPMPGRNLAPESEQNGEPKGSEYSVSETIPCKRPKQDCFTVADTLICKENTSTLLTPNAVGNGSARGRFGTTLMKGRVLPTLTT
jgi:hypothetical protein